MSNNESGVNKVEQETNVQSERVISRREVLATLGIAGAALTTGLVLHQTSNAAGFPSSSVSKAVYGKQSCCLITVPTVDDLATLSVTDAENVRVVDPDRGGIFTYSSVTLTVDNGIVFSASDGGRWVRLNGYEQPINVKWFGAMGDSVADDTTSIQAAIDVVGGKGGGSVYFPRGKYKVTTNDDKYSCIWIPFNSIEIYGEGEASEIFTTQDAHVPIHVSPGHDVTVKPSTGKVKGFSMHDMCVRGTGNYTNYGLGKGRGILLVNVENAIIRNNFVYDMSMNGITSEHGYGQFLVTGNIVGNCKYTAINYNGICYQSVISNNICYGSDGGVNAVAIQVDGHCIVTDNTVFGSITNYANCGGIMWGEGNFHGVGSISGNLVKHCRYGIKAIYHGPCNIQGNTIINCRTTSGIILLGGTTTTFTVASADNVVANNLIINCFPMQIETSADRTHIHSNKLLYLENPVNSSGSSAIDSIIDVRPEYGIHVTANDCTITSNVIDGPRRGIIVRKDKRLSVMEGNEVRNTSHEVFAWEASFVMLASHGVPIRKSAGGGVYKSEIFGSSKPGSGFWQQGDTWYRSPMAVGQSLGETVVSIASTDTTASTLSGSTTISVTSAVGILATAGNMIGVQLDNNTYHWTTVSSVSGSNVVLSASIPAGRSVNVGAQVVFQEWYSLGTL